jgi:hypothetical protein
MYTVDFVAFLSKNVAIFYFVEPALQGLNFLADELQKMETRDSSKMILDNEKGDLVQKIRSNYASAVNYTPCQHSMKPNRKQ